MSHPHAELITKFYDAFSRRDGATMASCYHANAEFQDEVFTLRGSDIGMMWTMLCERGADLRVVFRDVVADDTKGSAHWDADYTFSQTGRMVHNEIDAVFTFEDGLIRTHRDRFPFWKWTRMALGVPGLLLGWTPCIRSTVQKKGADSLAKFIAEREGGAAQ